MNLLTLLMAQDVAMQAGEELATEVMTEVPVAEMSLLAYDCVNQICCCQWSLFLCCFHSLRFTPLSFMI